MKIAVMMEQEEFDATMVVEDFIAASKAATQFGDKCRYLKDGRWWLAMNHLGLPNSAISYPIEVIGGIQEIRSPEETLWKAACGATNHRASTGIDSIIIVMPQDSMSTIVVNKPGGDVETWVANDDGTFERP